MFPVMFGLVTLYWLGIPIWILGLWLIGFHQYFQEERLLTKSQREQQERLDEPLPQMLEIAPSRPSYPETEGLRCERCGRSFSTSWGS